MSYLRHWKMSRSPFSIRENAQRIFTGGTVEEALARCEFLLSQRKQLGVLIGPSGVGKTTLLDYFSRHHNSQSPQESVVRIDMRCADLQTVPNRILKSLRSSVDRDRSDAWDSVIDQLLGDSLVGHRTVLVFDNVYEVQDDALQSLARLWSVRGNWIVLLSVNDESMVELPRWLLEYCELKIELSAWDLGQTADYFDFALTQLGARDDIFDGQAITRIQELSEGIPRKMVQISELALVAGAVRKADQISAELIDQVCDEFTVSFGTKFPTFWGEQRLNAG